MYNNGETVKKIVEVINQNKISATWARINTQKAIDDFSQTDIFAGILSEVYGYIRQAASKGEGMTMVDFSRYIKTAKLSPSLVASALGRELLRDEYQVDFKAPKKGQFLLFVFWGVPTENKKGDLME